jgi:radical SAM protein with 4Fe4S-binding SPASM domain
VEFKFDPLVNPRTDCSQSPLAVRLTPEQAVALEFRDPVRRADYLRLAEWELSTPLPVSSKKYTCGGGHNGCAIDPNGKMTICILSHREGYDLRSGSFRQGWEGRLQEIRSTENTRQTICTNCQIRSICAMCPANGELEALDAESPVDFLCPVAPMKAYTLGLQVPAHGDCSCCPGGTQHAQLLESANRLNKDSAANPGLIAFPGPRSLLPVLGSPSGCSSGGCSSCGAGLMPASGNAQS